MNKKILIPIFCVLGIIVFLLFIFVQNSNKQIQPVPFIPEPTKFILQPTVKPSPVQNQGGGLETEEYKQDEKNFIQRTPILQKLPEKSNFFGIEYIDEQHLIIHAKTTDKQRDYQEAQKWFAENKIDTTKIIIEYQ